MSMVIVFYILSNNIFLYLLCIYLSYINLAYHIVFKTVWIILNIILFYIFNIVSKFSHLKYTSLSLHKNHIYKIHFTFSFHKYLIQSLLCFFMKFPSTFSIVPIFISCINVFQTLVLLHTNMFPKHLYNMHTFSYQYLHI